MDPISKTFVAALEGYAQREKIPILPFRKGQPKDDLATKQRKKFHKAEGAVFTSPALSTAMVNHFYLYCVDRDFGPFFLKFSTDFLYKA